MARQRKQKADFPPLRQPDRSAPDHPTLLDFAQERNLFDQADQRQRQLDREQRRRGDSSTSQSRGDDGGTDDEQDEDGKVELPPGVDRFLEALLYTVTMSMLHFTFDVFVHNQYGTEINWFRIIKNTVQAEIVFVILFYPLHPHAANPILLPFLPQKHQHALCQAIFFCMSVVCGCYLVYITNTYGYLAKMKAAPPLGCLWLWAVVELDLLWAAGSLVIALAFLWLGGYSIS